MSATISPPCPLRAIACGSYLGLLAILGAGTGLLPAIAQTPESSQPSPTQRLIGTWEGDVDGYALTFNFQAGGRLLLISEGQENALTYTVNPNPSPMHLDITLPNGSVVETIFEFTPEGDMRLQLVGTNPGEPRPPRFNNATLLTKTATKASENGDDFTAIESTVRQWLATNGGVPVPVSISPIHIVGDYALATYLFGEGGGQVLLKYESDRWQIVEGGGGSMQDANYLMQLGVPRDIADELAAGSEI